MSQSGKTPSDKSRPIIAPHKHRFDAPHTRPVRGPHYPPGKETREDR